MSSADDQAKSDLFERSQEKTTQVTRTCNELRKYLTDLREMKKQNSATDTSNRVVNDEMRQFMTKGLMLFLQFRAAHREAFAMTEPLNEVRSQFQSKTDDISLRLSNLQYEAHTLQKQIHECKQFHSRHDQIPLVSENEFKEKYSAKENVESMNEHELMLHRLKYELEERKQLKTELGELHSKQNQVQIEIKSKKAFVDGLKGSLKSIKDKSVEIHNKMISTIPPSEPGIIGQKEMDLYDRANSLPYPLYTLFNRFNTHRSQYQNSISIAIREKTILPHTNQQEVSSADGDNIDNLPPRKRIRAATKASVSDEKLTPFKQSIFVEIHGKDKKSEIIEFFLLQKVNIVTVHSEEKAVVDLLNTLIPHDTGDSTPNASELTEYDFSDLECGRPYRWAQYLSGLHYPSRNQFSNESDLIKNFSVQSFIELFKYKTRALKVLQAELKDLNNLKVPKSALLGDTSTGSIKFIHPVKLHSFTKQSASSLNGVSTYTAVFKSVPNHIMQCNVIVNDNDYPLITPRITSLEIVKTTSKSHSLTVPDELKQYVKDNSLHEQPAPALNTDMLDIEHEVNIVFTKEYCKSYIYSIVSPPTSDHHFKILSHLISHLAQCLSIYLQVETNSSSKLYLRDRRGRDRRMPFSFNKQLTQFNQQ